MSSYNWKEILKNKSDSDLISFFHNDLINEPEAKYFAICEMELRSFNNENVESLKNNLIEDCENHIKDLRKKSFREYLIKINPYIILVMALYFLIVFISNPDLSLHNIGFIGLLFFGTGSVIAFIVSKLRIKFINRTKRKRIEIDQNIIKKITAHNSKLYPIAG